MYKDMVVARYITNVLVIIVFKMGLVYMAMLVC